MVLSNIRPGKVALWALFFSAISFSIGLSYIGLRTEFIFSFDQARDAFEAYAIWHNHDFKILGPVTDIPGVHHGVFWYYFLAIIYFFTQGYPHLASIVFFVIFLGSVPLSAWIVYKIFKNATVVFVFTLLYINAPLFHMFNRWMSNPAPSLILGPLLLYFLYTYVKNREKKYLFFIGLVLGLLIHADFAFGMFFITLLLYCIYYRLKFSLRDILLFFLGLCISVSTFILAEIKFQGRTMQSLLNFISHSAGSKDAAQIVNELFHKILDAVSFTVLPLPKFIIVLLIIFAFLKYPYKKNKYDPLVFLLLWFTTLILFKLFSAGFVSGYFMLAPFLFPLVAITSYLLVFYIKKIKVLIAAVACIYILQLMLSISWIKNHYMPFSPQQGMTIDQQEKIISYTYLSSKQKPFTIKTLTNPLYINTTWAYLYEQYGKNKYGYLPYFDGRSQKGYLGSLPERNFDTDIRYLIIEPQEGIPKIYVTKIIYEEDRVSDIIEEKKFGKFILQKRRLHKNKGEIPIPQTLLDSRDILEE